MFTDYIAFEIAIYPRQGDSFPCSVHCALGGDARGLLTLPLSDREYQLLEQRLSSLDADEAVLSQLGQILFTSLFQGPIKEVYSRSQGGLKPNQGLRLVFTLPPNEPEVAALPWELLYDPDQGPLALLDMPIVRYLPQSSPTPTLKTPPPLTVLLTGAQTAPGTHVRHQLDDIKLALDGLIERGLINVIIEPHLTPQKFLHLVRQGVHVWHFVGRGGFEEDQRTGRLAFEDAAGDVEWVSSMQLGVLLNRSGARLIILDTYESARLALQPLRNMAPALIRAQVSAVIAMQFRVPEQATRAFASEFYTALAEGLPIDACVTEGRKATMNATGIGQADWSTPVVYTRAEDGLLFDLSSASKQTNNELQIPTVPAAPTALPSHKQARKAQIMISYKRNTPLDEPLARRMYAAFQQAGHTVFIDRAMKVGVEWAREIQRQIEASDFIVVLLSQASVQSEMVAKEAEWAYAHFQSTNKARLLPVRVAFQDPLPYQMSHYLDKFQYAEWADDSDTERVIEQLLDAVADHAPLPLTPGPIVIDERFAFSGVPRPAADPRFIEAPREPGGGVKLRSDFYIEREGDMRLQRELQKTEGITTTIRAPRQSGKTSLLIRGIAQAQSQHTKIITLDLQAVEERFFHDLDTFLRYFVTVIFTRLRLDPATIERAWGGALGAPDKTTYLLEDYVLGEPGTKIILAIDEADRLLKTTFQDTFFGLLRFWHNNRAMNERWDNLSILMVISTEPHLLISDITQSPFNVGTKIVLEDFTALQVQELNQRYHSPLIDQELPELIALLNGHPYLTSKALYTLVTDETITWAQLKEIATAPKGPFSDHLRRYLWLLRDQPQLREALKEIMTRGRCTDELIFYRLLQAGLVQGSDSQACACRCKLYADYLKDKL